MIATRRSVLWRPWWVAGLAVLVLLTALAWDHRSMRGELEEESAPSEVAGRFWVAWHRMHLGLFDGHPRLDPRSFTVLVRIEYRGRQLEFESARTRFDELVEEPDTRVATRSMFVETHCLEDSTLAATVEVVRVFRDRPRFALRDTPGGRTTFRYAERSRSMSVRIFLWRATPGGEWVILARGHQAA